MHTLVELVSSSHSEYGNLGVLEVNREGGPVIANPPSKNTLDSPDGFHVATEGIRRHLSNCVENTLLVISESSSISFKAFLWMRMLNVGLKLI